MLYHNAAARTRLCLAAMAMTTLLAACDDSTSPDDDRLVLAFTGLEPLAAGFHYEGWAVTPAGPVSTGKFNVGTGGALVTLAGATIAGGEFRTSVDLGAATAIVITIEPSGDVDAVPAATKVLAGPVSANSASLTIGAPQAVNSDFASAAGKFILATPTDGANTNETSGVWFLEIVAGAPRAGLTLPTLPEGWQYEGWAVINGRPVTTGAFLIASGADLSAPFSGPQAGPPFPGEDFLLNAPTGLVFPTNLSGGMAVISVEPVPDDSPSPFAIKPLVGAIPAGASSGVVYTMGLNVPSFPTGVATIR
jgi:hypothetical protein